MFDSLLGGKFSKKCKYYVKRINSRLELIRKKKHATVKILKKDVADLLANGHDSNAFGRIDALIVEMNHSSCYVMIEQYCQCILNQLPCLQKQRECPEEVMEAISTLIFAATRFSDLPELYDLRRVFTERYGSHMESSVNAEFVEKMQKKSFSSDRKLQLMQDIAGEFSVKWDYKAFQQKRSSPPALPSDIPNRSSNNNEQRSHAEMNRRNAANYRQRKEAVLDAATDVNCQNRAAANIRKEAMFNVDVTVDRKKEADINSDAAVNSGDRKIFNAGGAAVNSSDRRVFNAGGSFNGRKELILNADNTVNGRKETVMNSVFAVNRRNEAAVFSERESQDVSSKERWEPPPRSSVQRQQVLDAATDVNCQNRAAANIRKEAMFNVDVTVDRKKEADINSDAAVNSGDRKIFNAGAAAVNSSDRRVFNAGGSFNGRKELILNADNTVNGRKETVMNSVFAVNRRNEAAVFSERESQDVSSKERWEPPPRSSVQRQQVQPEPRDIHVIPIIRNDRSHDPAEKTRKVSAAVEETESMEPAYGNAVKPKGSQNSIPNDDWFKPKVSQNGFHKDDQPNEGIARGRLPMAQERPGLIGLEKQSVGPVISRDVKAVNMIPPYTNQKGLINGSDAVDCDEVLDPTVQERRPTLPLSSKDARPISMIPPPYTKPKFRSPSNPADDTKLANEPVTSSSTADGGERAKPVSVRRRPPKLSLVIETDSGANDAKPMSQHPYAEEIVDRHHRKPAEEEIDGGVKHDQLVRGTSSSRRKHGSRRSNATYDGDCDEEEEVMDRLLRHLSKKGLNHESSKRRPRTGVPPAEVAADTERPGEHHYGPERVALLPPEPTSPVVDVSVGKGPARATSKNPDMLSPNGGGRLHARLLADYDDLAARFIALKNS